MKKAVIASRNRKRYRLNFTRANQDCLLLNTTIPEMRPFTINFDLKAVAGTQYVFTNNIFTFRMFINSSGVVTTTGLTINHLLIDGVAFPTNTNLSTHVGKTIQYKVTALANFNQTLTAICGRDTGDVTLDCKLNWFAIDKDVFYLQEGQGFGVVSSGGMNATGSTNQNLSYWNNNVWELVT